MGCVYRRKGGTIWWIKYPVEGDSRYESSKSTVKQDAIDLLKKRLNRPLAGSPKLLVGELLDDLLVYYKVHKPKSYARFCVPVVKQLRSYFGDWKATRVTSSSVNTYIKHRQEEDKANGTINREISLLRRAFRLAFEATPPKVQEVPRMKQLPEAEPRQGFLEQNNYEILKAELPDYVRPVFVVAYHTGARKSEILNLKKTAVDWNDGVIRLHQGETKNGQGRVLPIYGDMIPTLREVLAKNTESPWLFGQPDGSRILYFKESWKSACKRAGVPGLLFHDLRRSAVRNMLRAGIPQHTAMKISGHKDAKIFQRYNIIDEKDFEKARDQMIAFFNAPRVPEESTDSYKNGYKQKTPASAIQETKEFDWYPSVADLDAESF